MGQEVTPPVLTKRQRIALQRKAGYVPVTHRIRLARRRANNEHATRLNYPGWCGHTDAGTARRLPQPNAWSEGIETEAARVSPIERAFTKSA